MADDIDVYGDSDSDAELINESSDDEEEGYLNLHLSASDDSNDDMNLHLSASDDGSDDDVDSENIRGADGEKCFICSHMTKVHY